MFSLSFSVTLEWLLLYSSYPSCEC